MKLRELAYARSGDKGSDANIGVIAYTEKGYEHLKNILTPEQVANHFECPHPKRVTRFELPNLLAFNFILEDILGGGGSISLAFDAQGKALGQRLLDMEIPNYE